MNQLNHYETINKFQSSQWLWSQLYFILSWIEYPDNIGHFIRLSAWLWIDKILLHNCKITNKSISVWRNKEILIEEIESLQEYLTNSIDKFYAIEITNKSVDYKSLTINSKVPIWIILWSEKNGIDEEFLEIIKDHIHVPMYGQISSMNVSHAWAIVAYEIASKLNDLVSLI